MPKGGGGGGAQVGSMARSYNQDTIFAMKLMLDW